MKIRKLLLSISALIIIAQLLPATVRAHPGDTDENGGHTVADTGEYHYHHGYPAHDHYDIDGDGVADCPYDFDDSSVRFSFMSSPGLSDSSNSPTPAVDSSSGSDYTLCFILFLLAMTVLIPLLFEFKEPMLNIFKKLHSKAGRNSKDTQATEKSTEATEALALQLCRKLWRITLKFIHATDFPSEPYYTTYFWSAFLFSVHDILDQYAITDAVQDQYLHTAAALYRIPLSAVNLLAKLKNYQSLTYQKLCDSKIKPCSKDGAAEILFIAVIIGTPENEELPNDPPPLDDVIEFMSEVAELTNYCAKVLSKTSSRANSQETASSSEHLKESSIDTSAKKQFSNPQSASTPAPHQGPKEETVYLMEARNGMLVRVPESKLEAWQKAQASGERDRPLNSAEQQLKERILQDLYKP